MAEAGALSGLLHLGAIAVAVTAGYMGLDRVESGPDNFDKGLATLRKEAGILALQLAADTPSRGRSAFRWKYIRIFYPSAAVLFVAGEKYALPWVHRVPHFIYRQFYAPLLDYFRSTVHLRVVGLMAILSIAIFIFLNAFTLKPMPLMEYPSILKSIYWVLAASIVWIVFGPCRKLWQKLTVGLSLGLLTVVVVCLAAETAVSWSALIGTDPVLRSIFWVQSGFIIWVFFTVAVYYKLTKGKISLDMCKVLVDRAQHGTVLLLEEAKQILKEAEEILQVLDRPHRPNGAR